MGNLQSNSTTKSHGRIKSRTKNSIKFFFKGKWEHIANTPIVNTSNIAYPKQNFDIQTHHRWNDNVIAPDTTAIMFHPNNESVEERISSITNNESRALVIKFYCLDQNKLIQ